MNHIGLIRGQLDYLAMVDGLGRPCWGAVWLQGSPCGDRLLFCVPPGGDVLGVEGLSGRRFYSLPSREQVAIVTKFIERMREMCLKTVEGECPCTEEFVQAYPGVHDFLGRTKLADGTARTRSKLTIFYDGPRVKIGLTEPDLEMSAFVTSEGFFEALQALEEAVQSETLDWRKWWSNGKSRGDSKRR